MASAFRFWLYIFPAFSFTLTNAYIAIQEIATGLRIALYALPKMATALMGLAFFLIFLTFLFHLTVDLNFLDLDFPLLLSVLGVVLVFLYYLTIMSVILVFPHFWVILGLFW